MLGKICDIKDLGFLAVVNGNVILVASTDILITDNEVQNFKLKKNYKNNDERRTSFYRQRKRKSVTKLLQLIIATN